MPSLGADMEAGTLVEWLVKPGTLVKRGDIIALVDTQKGLFDIEVFDEGKIEQLIIKEHQKVPVGTVMALISNGKQQEGTQEVTPVKEKGIKETKVFIKASPLAKRMAEEKGLDLSLLHGTGEEGAITKTDVEEALKAKVINEQPVVKEVPEPVVTKETKTEKSLATSESLRMAVAAAMSKSNSEIPHYYVQTAIDMTKALAWLSEINKQRPVKQRLLPIALIMKAVAKALTDVPSLNAFWDKGVQLKEEINIGLAISLRTGGIMIPGCRDAEQKNSGRDHGLGKRDYSQSKKPETE
jgi:pyruvate dehydrogenase E2 component (dihydrolipoamide acetyltransferase)